MMNVMTEMKKTRQLHVNGKGGLRRQQQGAALLVALILLVLMTLLGISALQSGALEERMAGHTYDRSISFQSAEAALRETETYLNALATKPVVLATDPQCKSFAGVSPNPSINVCRAPTDGTEFWKDAADDKWTNATKVSSGSVDLTPQYIIEYLGATFTCLPQTPGIASDPGNCKRYRITVKSNAGDDRANVTLQSIFATE
jgi:type IV pilus assembly protein PilX